MKRSIVSLLLALLLLCNLFPATVLAEGSLTEEPPGQNQNIDDGTNQGNNDPVPDPDPDPDGGLPPAEDPPVPPSEDGSETTPDAPSSLEKAESIMNSIATSYVNESSPWVIMDMAAYESLRPDSTAKTQKNAEQSYINATISAITKTTASATDHAKAEIILRAIGGDTGKLYPVNGNTPFDNAVKLRPLTSEATYEAPWLLLADHQGRVQLDDAARQALIDVFPANRNEDGLLGYTWGGNFNIDIDTTAMAIPALAPYYESNEVAKEFVDKALVGLSKVQNETTASLGDANKDAMMVVALVSLGLDPSTDTRFIKNELSILDALLSYANEDGTAFLYNGSDNKPNPMATEQGFRGLIATMAFQSEKKAYNIYDFSKTTVGPLRATGGGTVTPPAPPSGDTSIKVSFTLKSDTAIWIPKTTLTLPNDAKVYHALIKALGSQFVQEGAESGYVHSMTNTKTGETLKEFDKGSNSGWLYKLNGLQPSLGLNDQALKDGDVLVWFYTKDWTLESGGGGSSGGSTTVTPPTTSGDKALSLSPSPTLSGTELSASLSQADLEAAAKTAKKNNATSLTIDLSKEKNTTSASLSLSVAGLKTLGESVTTELLIHTPTGHLQLSNALLLSLTNTAKEGNLSIRLAKETPDGLSLKSAPPMGSEALTVTIKAGNQSITDFGGASMVISLPVDGNTFSDKETYYLLTISENGQQELGQATITTQNGIPYAQVKSKHLSSFLLLPEISSAFDDVTKTHWAYDAVNYTKALGLLKGTNQATFAPDDALSRAMVVTILHRMSASPAPKEQADFTDVSSGDWYANAVLWATEHGLVSGYGDGVFGGNDPVTREQLATILYRYSLFKQQDCKIVPITAYSDQKDISPWAKDAFAWAVGEGFLSGTTATTLSPTGTATRAQVATILLRYCQ